MGRFETNGRKAPTFEVGQRLAIEFIGIVSGYAFGDWVAGLYRSQQHQTPKDTLPDWPLPPFGIVEDIAGNENWF
jgi:hypothetical protein